MLAVSPQSMLGAVSFITTDRGMPWRKESTVLVVILFLLPIITAEVNDYLI